MFDDCELATITICVLALSVMMLSFCLFCRTQTSIFPDDTNSVTTISSCSCGRNW